MTLVTSEIAAAAAVLRHLCHLSRDWGPLLIG